jgi:Autographiviridae endonuclease VII
VFVSQAGAIESPVPPFTATLTDTRPGARDAQHALSRWMKARGWARHAMLREPKSSRALSTYAEWHTEQLRPHRSNGLVCGSCHYVLPRTSEFFHTHALEHEWLATCKLCVGDRYGNKRTPEKSLAARCARYGVTIEWYRERVATQNGNCGLCLQPPDNGRYKSLMIDHDHETGLARGPLCSRCNQALGLTDDDPERLARMAAYLRESRSE